MGLVAPVAAVLSAAIPTFVSAFADGFRVSGRYRLYPAGIASGSSPGPKEMRSPEGLGVAVLAGMVLLVFSSAPIRGNASALWWPLVRGRCFSGYGSHRLFGRHLRAVQRRVGMPWLPTLDIGGRLRSSRAAQTGRLDAAVVLSSLIPRDRVLARIFLHDTLAHPHPRHGAALAAVPMIAG